MPYGMLCGRETNCHKHPEVLVETDWASQQLKEDRGVTKDVPKPILATYKVKGTNEAIRTYLDYVKKSLGKGDKVLVDVRSPAEFTGEITAPPEYPNEHAQRGRHIPGAVNIPWSQAVK